MDLLPLILLTLVAVAGATVGVVVALRAGTAALPGSDADDALDEGPVQVAAEIHTGWEQTLISLTRELGLPRGAQDTAYGQLYLEPLTEHRLLVRTRSEIGRGFLGAIDILPRRGPTRITYAVLRLPGDEQLHTRVHDFEVRLVTALRRIDAAAEVRVADPMDRATAPMARSGRA